MNTRSGLRTILTASVATLALTLSAHADPDEKTLETVKVWGTTIETDLFTLDEGELSLRQADHLSDLLRIVPGVDIGGTHSVNSRINIRGLDDRKLAIYIDGALQTNYLYHHLGNLLINADILTSADVQVGANSVTHDGVGGAIRFRTKSAADLLSASDRSYGGRLMASYNDNAQTAWSATGYAQLSDKFDVLGYFHQVDRDNFEDGNGKETIGSDGTTENLLLKFGFQPTRNQRIQLSFDQLEDGGDYTQRPDMGVLTNEAITGDILLPTDYTRETINATYELDLGDAFTLMATYFTNDLELKRDETNPNVGVQGGNTRKMAASDNQGFNLLAQSNLNWGSVGHSLKYGIQYFDQNLSFDSDIDTNTNNIIEQSSESTAVFLEDEISFTSAFRLRPGVRFVNDEITYVETGETGSFDDIVFGLAAEADMSSNLTLLASYTDIFQAPELAEPFAGSGSNKIVNPLLDAETGTNLEIGFRWRSEIAGGDFGLGANIFETRIKDYIGEVDVPGTTTDETMDANLGEMKLTGFEVSANYLRGPWDVFVTYNNSNFDTDDLDTSSVSESFREIGDTTSYEVSYSFEQLNLSLAVSGQFIEAKTTSLGDEKEGYSVHNIAARWLEPFGVEGLSVTGGVDNLFDEAYTSHASRLGETTHPVFGPLILNDVEPGRNIKLTIAKVF